MRNVTISRVMNGIVVSVGCQTLVFEMKDIGNFLQGLNDYIKDSQGTERKWISTYGVRGGSLAPVTPAPPVARDYEITLGDQCGTSNPVQSY